MGNSLKIIVLVLFCLALDARAGALFLEGASWRYYKGTNTPAAQASLAWTDVGYDDAGWSTGNSGIGYGDGDDATTLSDMQNNYVSVFTRKTFVIANTSAVTHLSLAADIDDGFVAYINGQEVARRNMPGGAVTHSTLASASHESSRSSTATGNDKEFIALPPSALVNGTNVLAVSGHNVSSGSSDFTLIVALYTNVTLVRGPFVQMPSTNGLAIAWRTDALSDSVVEYGFDTGYAGGTVSNGTLTREHLVPLPDLEPGTTYLYRVRSGGVVLAAGVPLQSRRNPDQPYRVLLVGDFGVSSSGSTAVAARVATMTGDVFMTVGDNIYYNGEPGSYDFFWFQRYAATMGRTPTLPALGNHDNNLGNAIWIQTNFYLPTNGPAGWKEKVYSYDYANMHVAVIDSNPIAGNDSAGIAAIKTWLSNDLVAATNTWKFVVLHHPPYTSEGSHVANAAVQAHIVPILEQTGVHLVFQGHNHFYERINPINGVGYITTGHGGQGLYSVTDRKIYSASIYNDQNGFTVMDIDGPRLTLRSIDRTGAERDRYHLDISAPFKMDGLLDNPAWGRATNNLVLYAAIRGNSLYVAMQDAGETNDHFIFLNDHQGTNRLAAWSKSGNNMQWSAFLADENDNGYHAWYGAAEQVLTNPAIYQAAVSGLNNNGTNGNGVIEGILDLAAHFGTFPAQLYLEGAPYASTNAGSLVASSAVPTNNGSANINSNEYLFALTRDLALDLPAADAGPDQFLEAGMSLSLAGDASVPSGLPAHYAWTQTVGEAVALSSTTSLLTGFTFTQAIDNSTNLHFRLTVSDPRFDSNDTVEVTVVPVADTDGDGLSDQEELTGLNNVLTFFHPGGWVTSPTDDDTDDDGLSDGAESLAGTSPIDGDSVLTMADTFLADDQLLIQWPSVTQHYYTLYQSTNLAEPATALASNIPAAPPMNTYTTAVPETAPVFHFIEVQQPGP